MGNIRLRRQRFAAPCAALAMGLSCALAAPASAGMVDLGGGWQASWDSSLDGFVDITAEVIGNTIFIEKTAEFTQGAVNGIFPAIPIVFQQTQASSIDFIAITNETVTNSTGEDWTGFRMDVLDGGDAFFDVAMTAGSGGPGPIGWDIAPFTTGAYSANDTTLILGGGLVPDGGVWTPGAAGGELWISVNSAPDSPFTTFVLKETPVPAPAAIALLAAGGLFVRSRRRD